MNMTEPNPEDYGLKDYTKYFSPKEDELKKIKKELNIQLSKSELLITKLKDKNIDFFVWIVSVVLFVLTTLFLSLLASVFVFAPVAGLLMLVGLDQKYFLLVAFSVLVVGFFLYQFRRANFKYESVESKLDLLLKYVDGDDYKEKIDRLKKSINQVERIISYKEALKKYERQKAETGEDWWKALSSYELEEAVASLFNRKGFQASVTKKSGDGGVDVIVRSSDKTLLIQCKGWESKVGVKPIREMAGVVQHHTEKNCVGIILSTNGFTSEAIKFANQSKTLLWDSKTLSEIAKGQYEV